MADANDSADYAASDVGSSALMGVTRIVANLKAADPIALAKFCKEVFQLDLPFDMGWIAFLEQRRGPEDRAAHGI